MVACHKVFGFFICPCEGGGSGVVGVQCSVPGLLWLGFLFACVPLLARIGSWRGVFRAPFVRKLAGMLDWGVEGVELGVYFFSR